MLVPPTMVPNIVVLPMKGKRQMVHTSVCDPACTESVCLWQREDQYWLLLLLLLLPPLLHLLSLLLKGLSSSKYCSQEIGGFVMVVGLVLLILRLIPPQGLLLVPLLPVLKYPVARWCETQLSQSPLLQERMWPAQLRPWTVYTLTTSLCTPAAFA